MNHKFSGIGLALSATLCVASPLYAQDAVAPEQVSSATELEQLKAQLSNLTQKVAQLEAELGNTENEPAEPVEKTEVTAAELSGSTGWSFKPRGRLQFDVGTTMAPAFPDVDDGFGNEVRRARLGASGDLPAGFGYKFEVDFAGNDVEANDAYLSYANGPVEIIVGHHNNFQSLEELTSSLHTSFIERAAFTDAFGFERRIGSSVTYSRGSFIAQAGVFTDNFDDTSTGNYSFDGRLVLLPRIGDAQLHLGGSIHFNEIEDPSSVIRYRQRPLVHFASDRYVDTGGIPASDELGYGLEAALVKGRFHAAAEGFWQEVGRSPNLDTPTFFGGYLETGLFLTEDTRGYKKGKFDRTKPSNPLGDGGMGSVQINLRYDHLDLDSGVIQGGLQNAYLASLVWKPTDYTLFSVNYGHLAYTGAAIPTASGDRSYAVDTIAVRAQVDF